MAPTFALDLSLDGIRLLYRADGGWTVVGDVAIEDPALPERLAWLRAEAEGIAPGAVTTELVIPPSQIRYAGIPRPPAEALTEAGLLPALEGLTPLAPEDLAFDWEVEGDTLRLALVDRTTLAEAETFAEAHGFNPVSFGARPTPAQFPRAPHFGTTARAAEPAPVLPPPASDSAPAPEPETEPEAAPAPETVGTEALARSLSAPRPGDGRPARPRAPRRAAMALDRRVALGAGGGLAAALALALFLGFGGGSDPAASLPDTPPDVALSLPALASPETAEAAPLSPATPAEDTPPAVAMAAAEAPDRGETPEADTAAPPALADASPLAPAAATVPAAPPQPAGETTEEIYFASIDPATPARDALALVPPEAFPTARRPAAPLPPPPAGTTFDIAGDGLVVPTPDGAVTPDGIVVTLGRPPLAPPAAPARTAEITAETAPEPTELALALPDRRPRARPAGLVERNERTLLGGRTRAEMAALGPLPRPASDQAAALAAAPAAPSEFAVASSRAPRNRPDDLATRVATANAIAAALAAAPPVEERQAEPAPAPAPPPAPAPAQAPPPAAVAAAPDDLPYDDDEPEAVAAAPNIPTSASVARQATIRNAIALRDINLIGVYGTERDRRALVRMPNGRYVKVKVGDRLDGGQIAAIGRNQLRYVKGGRNITLTVPSG